MAKNDVVLLDSIIDERLAEQLPSNKRDEVFEYFVFEQILKDFDLSRDEIESGWIDGQNDGGIDGFYVFINGRLLQDPASFFWPKINASIDIRIVTCKHHDTFEQAPLNSMLASAQELFDLSLEPSQFKGQYSKELLEARTALVLAYRRLSIAGPDVTFELTYASRGDTTNVGENIRARANQIETLLKSYFSSCRARFEFVGAGELIAKYRRTKRFSLDLPFKEHLSGGHESYGLLGELDKFVEFVQDEGGNLRRYLFDSNVRDFLRGSRVNDDIAASLNSAAGPDFWWLNNGVTILATNAAITGKAIALQNIQIVNGLQTTETIYRHFQATGLISDSRNVLVKVLVSTDPQIRDRIIQATNNQNAVEVASLHATDKIQRDIEEILESNDWYYERRKNYYRNIGKPLNRFATPLYLASGFVALVLKNPAKATTLKARFMRNPVSYDAVFSENTPIELWPTIVEILKRVEDGLSYVRPEDFGLSDRFLSRWRNLVSLICVSRIIGTFSYKIPELLDLDFQLITRDSVGEVWKPIQEELESYKWVHGKGRPYKNHQFATDSCFRASTQFGISGAEAVGRKILPTGTPERPAIIVSDELLSQVQSIVSEDLWDKERRCWKTGADKIVATRLKCRRGEARTALRMLKNGTTPLDFMRNDGAQIS